MRAPFERVVAEHGAVVMRVCTALLGPIDAEDAWSETFLAALRAYPDLRPDSNVRGWLVTIAHNKSIDALRARTRTPTPTAAVPETPSTDTHDHLDGELRDALTRLPPKQRLAVVARHLADMSYTDIATLLESNEAAARRSVADAITQLRRIHQRGTRP